jgi:hypothetical protein
MKDEVRNLKNSNQWAVAVGRMESLKDEVRKLKKGMSGQSQLAESENQKYES